MWTSFSCAGLLDYVERCITQGRCGYQQNDDMLPLLRRFKAALARLP
jgi:hypothetical protein